jgi:hypothetical protein
MWSKIQPGTFVIYLHIAVKRQNPADIHEGEVPHPGFEYWVLL